MVLPERTGFDSARIRVINSEFEYYKIADEINRDCEQFNVLGFDCEWVPEFRDVYSPIALLQLATVRGNIYLIRTCQLEGFPIALRDLLEDSKILKVGIDPWRDVEKLYEEYNVNTESTLDLRFLAEEMGFRPLGLKKLAHNLLGMQLEKGIANVDHFGWEDEELNHKLQLYAAEDAFVSIELFKYFVIRRSDLVNGDRMRRCLNMRYVYNSQFDQSRFNVDDDEISSGKQFYSTNIRIINTEEEYNQYAGRLEKDCYDFNALGFGAIWDKRQCGDRPCPLLQLATARSLILLIRLCKIKLIPFSLKKLLENEEILKVGYMPGLDATQIAKDYNVLTKGTLDFQFLTSHAGVYETNKSNLFRQLLRMDVDDVNDKLMRTWEDEKLGFWNIQYAAKDAFCSIELFKNCIRVYLPWGNYQPYPVNWKKTSAFDWIDQVFDFSAYHRKFIESTRVGAQFEPEVNVSVISVILNGFKYVCSLFVKLTLAVLAFSLLMNILLFITNK